MISMRLDHYTLCSGVGHARGHLNAFDRALSAAGVSDYNLVKISSILPPNCQQEEKILLPKGLLLPTAMATIFSNIIGTRLSAAVAIAIPQNSNDIGVIMEHSAHSAREETEEQARIYAREAMIDRHIKIKDVVSVSSECHVELPEYYCAFASISLWSSP